MTIPVLKNRIKKFEVILHYKETLREKAYLAYLKQKMILTKILDQIKNLRQESDHMKSAFNKHQNFTSLEISGFYERIKFLEISTNEQIRKQLTQEQITKEAWDFFIKERRNEETFKKLLKNFQTKLDTKYNKIIEEQDDDHLIIKDYLDKNG